jgi:16S rRNA (guanine527-N7)-methyltransferase
LWAWNEKVNLTRHLGWDDFVGKDLRDVTQLSQLLEQGERVLDIGSGGGVPGLPLALLRSDLKVELAESVGKKAAILEDLKKACGTKVVVHAERGETVIDRKPFDVVTCRGVGSLAKLLRWLDGRWGSVGRVLAFKGPKWADERGEARHYGLLKGLQLRKAAAYETAGRGGECVILKIQPEEE